MRHFDIKDLIVSAVGYKGLPFPGAWFPSKQRRDDQDEFSYDGQASTPMRSSSLGSTVRKQDAQGNWYFLPVTLVHKDKEYEIPNAVISFVGKKTIVETAMVGRKGAVKELINIADYEISIQGAASDVDFPEAALTELNELYNINESLTLKCALTDIFLAEDDKVVIKNIDISDMRGTETLLIIKISLITDCSFELIIE